MLLEWLDKKGFRFGKMTDGGETLLQRYFNVVDDFDSTVVEYLLGKCNVNNADDMGVTAIFDWIANSQDVDILQLMIDHGADININYGKKIGYDFIDFWLERRDLFLHFRNFNGTRNDYSVLRILLENGFVFEERHVV